MITNEDRARIARIATTLIEAKGTADVDWLTHLARVAGATFDDLGVPPGTIVASLNGTIVTYDGLRPALGYATAGVHTVIWHVGMPAFSTCRNCGVGSGILLHGAPLGAAGEWELRCEACLKVAPRAVAAGAAA